MVTSFYAALLALFFIALSVRTVRLRRQLRIAVGYEHPRLLRAARAHGNFAEYVPMTLVLVFMVEQFLAAPWLIHLLGITLCCGRLAHAVGISNPQEKLIYRIVGMAMTFTVLGGTALVLLYIQLTQLWVG